MSELKQQVCNVMQQEHQKPKKKHVQWDEEKLKETQKFRGQFQKIDQPKTPYRANQESDEEMDNENKTEQQLALEASLNKAKINRQANHHKKVNLAELNAKLKAELQQFKSGKKNEMEDEEEEAARRKRQEFKKKRAQHYNQFKMIQKMKEQQWENEDD